MSCHSMVIYDDEGVEPPENVSVTIIATGPTLEFINLFDIILPETTVQIVDNDSEFFLQIRVFFCLRDVLIRVQV